MNGTDPSAREHCDCGLGNGGQVDDDAIAFSNVISLKHVAKPTDFPVQLLIGKRAFLARFAFPKKSRLVAPWPGQMTVETIFRNVQLSADEPFGEGSFPLKHPLPRLVPSQFFGFTTPKLVRLPNRFPVHFLVLGQALDSCAPLKVFGWFEDTFFDEVRFNVRFHQRKAR